MELAWPRLVDEELQAILDRNCLPGNPNERPESDNSLHAYLIEKSKNSYIADFFKHTGSITMHCSNGKTWIATHKFKRFAIIGKSLKRCCGGTGQRPSGP